MLTNTQSAQVIEELVKAAADSGEPVTITPVDEGALRAGAQALRAMDEIQGKVLDLQHIDDIQAWVAGSLRAAKETREQRDAAQREVERLRGALHVIYSIASRAQAEPELSTGDLVDICTICEDHGGDSPDPRDARIAELEAAMPWMKRERRYEYALRRIAFSGIHGEGDIPVTPSELREVARAALADTPPPDPASVESTLAAVARDDAERTIERMHGPATPDPRDEVLERAAQWLESAANRCESILETSPEYHLLGDIADYRREAAAIRAARGTK